MSENRAYVGTAQRTFDQAVVHFLEANYNLLGSRRVLALIAADIQDLVDQFYPQLNHVPSGWLVFTGVKASGPKAHPGQSGAEHELVTLAWPVLLPEDLQALTAMPSGQDGKEQRQDLLRDRLARVVEYGWQHPQGPVLLTLADLSCMFNLNTSYASRLLRAARKATGKPLLTKGYYFDQGMRPTHKAEIIALYEAGLDETDIARQTQHQAASVGHYIRGYERVKLLIKRQDSSIEQIVYLTGMQPNVVKAYAGMVYQYHPDLAPERVTPGQT